MKSVYFYFLPPNVIMEDNPHSNSPEIHLNVLLNPFKLQFIPSSQEKGWAFRISKKHNIAYALAFPSRPHPCHYHHQHHHYQQDCAKLHKAAVLLFAPFTFPYSTVALNSLLEPILFAVGWKKLEAHWESSNLNQFSQLLISEMLKFPLPPSRSLLVSVFFGIHKTEEA